MVTVPDITPTGFDQVDRLRRRFRGRLRTLLSQVPGFELAGVTTTGASPADVVIARSLTNASGAKLH